MQLDFFFKNIIQFCLLMNLSRKDSLMCEESNFSNHRVTAGKKINLSYTRFWQKVKRK